MINDFLHPLSINFEWDNSLKDYITELDLHTYGLIVATIDTGSKYVIELESLQPITEYLFDLFSIEDQLKLFKCDDFEDYCSLRKLNEL